MRNDNNLFTAGELANLFGISKQTLLYYDKINLLSPNYISENGYRHYSIQQYLDLEIIVNLRSLNISISEIKEFLQNRNKEKFLGLLTSQRESCENIIRENEEIIRTIDVFTNNLQKNYPHIFNQPLLNWQDERVIRLTDVSQVSDGKSRVVIYTKHAQNTFHNHKSLEKLVGWTIEYSSLISQDHTNYSCEYFSLVPNTPKHRSKIRHLLPAGLYLEVYFQGTYYSKAKSLAQLIQGFLSLNKLKPLGKVYIMPVTNNLTCDCPDEYINKIFLHVVQA